jgi:hypothetical protein
MSTFGHIRAILHEAPSAQGWRALCEALDEVSHDASAMQELKPYCAAHLESWPVHLRTARKDVFERVLSGEEVPYWSSVRHLDLSRMKGLPGVLGQVHEQALFAQLSHLNVEYCRLAPGELAQLLHVPGMATIEHLNLNYCDLGQAGAEVLASAEHLGALRELGVRRNKLKSKGGAALIGCAALSALTWLDAGYNQFGKKAGDRLINHEAFSSQLDYFDLCYGKVGASAVEKFVKSDKLGKMRSLNLRECGMEAGALRAMIARDDLTHLRELGLCSNPVGEALIQLGEASWLHTLTLLDVSSMRVNVNALREVLNKHGSPDLKVHHYGFHNVENEMPWRS